MEASEAFAGHEASVPAPVTYDQAENRYSPGTHAARDRNHDLSCRDHLARARARLRARSEYGPARYGTEDAQPLTAAERLELLAIAQYLARSYEPSFEIDNALRAGAAWAQVAAALGTGMSSAWAAYRQWADSQHDLCSWTQGCIGMSDEAVRRRTGPAGRAGSRHSEGIRR